MAGGIPPGTTSFPPRNPPSMKRAYFVSTKRGDGNLDLRGPFMCTRVPVSGTLQIPNFGEIVDVDDRLQLPLESQARAGGRVRDVATNTTYEILYARVWATFIEVLVKRTQGDQ